MMKKTLSVAAGLALALSLSLTALSGLLMALGTMPSLMLPMMRHFAPSADTGLPDAEYPALVKGLTGYLAGRLDTPQHTWLEDGEIRTAFGERELQHLSDCRALFRLDGTVLLIAGALTALLLIIALRRKSPLLWRTTVVALGAVEAIIGVLVIAAAVDFDALFVLFHRLSFSNDLWLLNPQTDLLIRLMPLSYFIACAAAVAVGWLALVTGAQIAAVMLSKRGRNA